MFYQFVDQQFSALIVNVVVACAVNQQQFAFELCRMRDGRKLNIVLGILI